MTTEDEELIIQLLIEQHALKIQMAAVNFEAIKDKMDVSIYELYKIKRKHIERIYQDGAALAKRKRIDSL